MLVIPISNKELHKEGRGTHHLHNVDGVAEVGGNGSDVGPLASLARGQGEVGGAEAGWGGVEDDGQRGTGLVCAGLSTA